MQLVFHQTGLLNAIDFTKPGYKMQLGCFSTMKSTGGTFNLLYPSGVTIVVEYSTPGSRLIVAQCRGFAVLASEIGQRTSIFVRRSWFP